MSVNFQKINNTNVSFGSRLPLNYRTVEKIVRDYANRGYKSATFLNDIRYSSNDNFINDYHKGLAMLKTAEAHTGIMRYRRLFSSDLKCKDNNDYMSFLAQIIDKVKLLNCGESAELIYAALTKLGIPCRVVSDKTMDHVFVVVNRSTPFTNYKNAKSGEFVADLWLKKTYKSVNEAYTEFKKLFGVTNKNELEDITDKPFKYSLMRPLTDEEKLNNEKTLKHLFENIDVLRREVECEGKALKKSTNHIQGRNKCQIKRCFEEDFEETINRIELSRRV